MAKLIYSAIASLDGYVADEDGNFDWAVPDEEVHTFINDLDRPLERVMNSIRNGLGMRETEIAREPRRPWNPHFYAVFAQVHNTL